VNDSVAWISGTNGWVGVSIDAGKHWSLNQVPNFEKSDFRSLYAFDKDRAIIANAGSPSNILITIDAGLHWKTVYTNNDTNSFFDGIDFWNNKEGIIYGDPINGRLSLLHTFDRGNHWEELPLLSRPLLGQGEASFAASGTGIRCFDKNKILITTGGKVSSLLLSSDKGHHWKRIQTPILQGEGSTGIFSVSAMGKKKLVIVGGDYLKDSLSLANVYYSDNGGKKWLRPIKPTRGYRECVEFIGPDTLIAVGPSGFDITTDGAESWQGLSDEKYFHALRKARSGSLLMVAGKGKIAVLHW
jgi:photosystem II stability/assembly factor-like uncharacterized protein